MKEIKIIYNEKIYQNYYDLLVHKITDDSSKKQFLALKDDCIILVQDEHFYFDNKERDFFTALEIFKSRITYKIDKRVHGIYIFPSSDYKFYFLDKELPIESREKGLRHITHIILLRYYDWKICYANKNINILPNLFKNIKIDDYIIKPNTILTIDENREIKFIENVKSIDVIDKFKTSIF